MDKVFRPNLGPVEQRLALRETIAHLEHLCRRGTLIRLESNDVVSYRPPGSRES